MNASRACRYAAIFVGLAGPVSAAGETLRDALAAAYTNSAELRAERARLKQVNERVPQALANTRPTIQAFGSIGSVHETTNVLVAPTPTFPSGTDTTPLNLPRKAYGVSLTEPLFRGGRTLAEYREAHDLVDAERARLIGVEQSVLLQAATAYSEVLRAEGVERLATKRDTVLRAQFDQAQGRFAAGALVRTDLLASQSAYDASRSQLASARAALAAARFAYLRDIGNSPGVLVFPETPFELPVSLADAEQQALASSPEIVAAERTLAAGRQHVRDVVGEGLPSVALQAALQHQEGVSYRGEKDDTRAVIVQMRVPIYTGGALSSRVRAARDDVEAQQATLDRLRETTRAAVDSAWEEVAAARTAVTALSGQVEADTLRVTGIDAQFHGGERTRQDVLAAEQALFEVSEALIAARKDLLVASLDLLAATGNLTAARLDLAVVRYDIERDYRRVHYGPDR